MDDAKPLCPSQAAAFQAIAAFWPHGTCFGVSASAGLGRTTTLRRLHAEFGGEWIGMGAWFQASRTRDPLGLEETLEQLVMSAFARVDTVFVDDLQYLVAVGLDSHFYPRNGLLRGAFESLTGYAAAARKRLVFGNEGGFPEPIRARAFTHGIKEFTPADYEFIARHHLGTRCTDVDFAKLHRFAPHLNGHQLRHACVALGRDGARPTTDQLVDYVRARGMTSNVDLGEVQPVDLLDLKGIDDLIASLEAKIILPFENDQLATELGVEPKRGVLIAGPPGTGKTTIGRALAHRLKSKFFLVDGTFISGTRSFYERISRVFAAAQRNAPSIVFIDDSDVMFENSQETGLYRYLLTMLDGLESQTVGKVCVILTAMNVGNLPPALVRSGRIELWLETRLPDAAARAAILGARLASLPPVMGHADVAVIADATDGMTGADLRQLVDDGKLLFAHDRARRLTPQPATAYFLEAVATVRANRERYARAEEQARANRRGQPPWFTAGDALIDECG